MDPNSQTEQTAQPSPALSIRPGMTVEVLTLENRTLFRGKVENFRNGAITIRDAKGDDLPRIIFNEEIRLKFFLNEGNMVIQGKICGSTDLFWKVDRLDIKYTKEQRAYFRQSISADIEAMCAERPKPGGGAKEPAPCRVLDISAGGLLIETGEQFEVGDQISITGVRFAAREAPFTFQCLVRRVGTPQEKLIRYGCQFEFLSPKEQDRLLQAIFVVQREEIKRKRERGNL